MEAWGFHFVTCAFVCIKLSRKPDEVRRRIEALMGDVPRVELFARLPAPGWDVWGNEVDSAIGWAPT